MTLAICVPAHNPRLGDLLSFLALAAAPEFTFIIITNEPDPINPDDIPFPGIHVLNTGSEEINLSAWWNLGHRYAKLLKLDDFMVTETDCRITPDNIFTLQDAMHKHDLSLVGPNIYGAMEDDEVHITNSVTSWGGRSVYKRICQTWMTRTDTLIRADERFVWWYADEQLDMLHRAERNGTGVIGASRYAAPPVQSTDPSECTQRSEGNRTSRRLFQEQWGFQTLA